MVVGVPNHILSFAQFQLDPSNARLWRNGQVVPVRPKPFALLCYLADNAARLIPKEELTKALWPQEYIGDSSLKGYIRALREVLGDNAETPLFIETVSRRGYRFRAAVERSVMEIEQGEHPEMPLQLAPFVARKHEMTQLHKWFRQVLQGHRHIVFVTGESGLGKTTVVDTFLAEANAQDTVWIGHGQCIEHYGAGEPYLPILEALGHLARSIDGNKIIQELRSSAPAMLAQMPAFVSESELETMQRRAQGATQQRMLREMAEALEALTVIYPIILWLDDLQWSDPSTLDLIAWLARRRTPARLLLIGSYRPTDTLENSHPLRSLKQELVLHRQCEELLLPRFTEAEVAQYLALRLSPNQFAPSLAAVLTQCTGGNPLFLDTLVDDLVQRKVIVSAGQHWQLTSDIDEVKRNVPESLRQMVELKIERLTPGEQHVLEVAALVGVTFTAAAVAAGLDKAAELVEEHCDELVRRGIFLRANGTRPWPNESLTPQYAFLHVLYQQVLYARLNEGKRARLSQRIGMRLEETYGERAPELAAELGLYFERGRDAQRAVTYLQLAAESAVQQSAFREALEHARKGLTLVNQLPGTTDRLQQELSLQLTRSAALVALQGFAADEVKAAYDQVDALCRRTGDPPQFFPALGSLHSFYSTRGDHTIAKEYAERLLHVARRSQHPWHLPEAHNAMGIALFFQGELSRALQHFEQCLALSDQLRPSEKQTLASPDLAVSSLSHQAILLYQLGDAKHAQQRIQQAWVRAEGLGHPTSMASAYSWSALLAQLRHQAEVVHQQAETLINLALEHELPFWPAVGLIHVGWALAHQGQSKKGIACLRQGLDVLHASGIVRGSTFWLAALAEACEKSGQPNEAQATLTKALSIMENTGERVYEAELYRLKGELRLTQKSKGRKAESSHPTYQEAEKCFLKAVEVARLQGAKSLESQVKKRLEQLREQQSR